MLQQRENSINKNGVGLPQPTKPHTGMAISIPVKGAANPRTAYHTSSSGFFSSSDESITSSSNGESSPLSENCHSLSSSYHGGFTSASGNNLSLNVYGTSPRTSVMFSYYSSPKGSYNRPHPHLIRTKSSDASHPHPHPPVSNSCNESVLFGGSSDYVNVDLDKNLRPEMSSNKPPEPFVHHLQQLDLRPRAWSESDKNRSNAGSASSMQNSRMSALRKLKMKLGQKGPLKRQKSLDEDDKNKSAASISSLEKVEEGRPLDYAMPTQRTQAITAGITKNYVAGCLHQEHETRKHLERRVGVVKSPPQLLPQVSENPEDYLIYQRFLEEHTCYDLMPTSSKLVVLDTRLEVKKAFHALIENSLRCAPLWDNEHQDYVGLFTVSDFVRILLAYHKCPNKKLEDLENQKISCWRKVLNSKKTLIHVPPLSSLFDALQRLTDVNIRRLAIVHPDNGDVLHVINHRRILHFLHLFMNELPKPMYMSKPVSELGLGRYKDVATLDENSPVIDALKLLDKHQVSGLPVLDNQGRVCDVFTKTDVLVLAGEQLFYDLSIKVKTVISLHSAVDHDESAPQQALNRMMPGSPALVRRKNQPREGHARSSTPIKAHPFLRDSNNAPRMMPSPLVGFSKPTSFPEGKKSKEKNRPHALLARKTNHERCVENENMGRGDAAIVSPPSTQVYLHRRRHLSSNFAKSTSISSHLVTVTKEDTLEAVVNSIVTADVLQAIVVDDMDHVHGVISIGDILRFMVYPTDEDGNIIKNEVGEKTSTKTNLHVASDITPLVSTRMRKVSDDNDPTGTIVQKDSILISDGGYSSGSAKFCSANGKITSFTCNNVLDSPTSLVSKKRPDSTKTPCTHHLRSGEKMERL